MKPYVMLAVFVLQLLSPCVRGNDCVCKLKNPEKPFPTEKLESVHTGASKCNRTFSSAQWLEVEVLELGVRRRLEQLEESVAALEGEDDGDLFGAVSLRVIELELAEVLQLILKLNRSLGAHRELTEGTRTKLQSMMKDMQELETFDHLHLRKKEVENKRLRTELAECQNDLHATNPPPTVQPGRCSHGHLVNVSGPRTYTITQYGSSYPYGAWGRDPKPPPGREKEYWLLALTSGDTYANTVRRYSSLTTLTLSVNPTDTAITAGNPAADAVQGPNAVVYGDALYYNCYDTARVCRFSLAERSVSAAALPQDAGFNGKYNFGRLDVVYSHSDLDLATDESGVWAVYATAGNFGNVVLSRVTDGAPPALGRTWHTSLHKRAVANTFVACGVLYATRHVDKDWEQIFYAFDTETGKERYDLRVYLKKMQPNIQSLNYNPRDRMLYVYSDAYVLSYYTSFQ